MTTTTSARNSSHDDSVMWDVTSSLDRNNTTSATDILMTSLDYGSMQQRIAAAQSADESTASDITDDSVQLPLAGCVIAVVVLGCASVVAAVLYAYLYYFRFRPGDRMAESARLSAAAGRGARWSVPHGHHTANHPSLSSSANGHHHGGGGSGGASAGRTHMFMFKKS